MAESERERSAMRATASATSRRSRTCASSPAMRRDSAWTSSASRVSASRDCSAMESPRAAARSDSSASPTTVSAVSADAVVLRDRRVTVSVVARTPAAVSSVLEVEGGDRRHEPLRPHHQLGRGPLRLVAAGARGAPHLPLPLRDRLRRPAEPVAEQRRARRDCSEEREERTPGAQHAPAAGREPEGPVEARGIGPMDQGSPGSGTPPPSGWRDTRGVRRGGCAGWSGSPGCPTPGPRERPSAPWPRGRPTASAAPRPGPRTWG